MPLHTLEAIVVMSDLFASAAGTCRFQPSLSVFAQEGFIPLVLLKRPGKFAAYA
jgi:hypothetical protein